jgi:hypothetical protein
MNFAVDGINERRCRMTPYEERLCRTCKYGKKPEYHKPCVVYRDDCQLYESIEEMTPKKAIIQLEYLKNNGFKTKEQFEALDMAIKALEQTELNPSYNGVKSELKPCEDYISREEALRHRHIIYDDDGVGYSVVRVDEIEQLPSVTPQQTCEDCISRTKLLSRIDAERKHLLDLKMDGAEHIIVHHARRIIEDMPSVTPQQTRWIPCSERLPERDENVLTYHRNESFDYQYVSWIDDYSGKWAGFIGNLSDEVLAWMPLPEGYKEE